VVRFDDDARAALVQGLIDGRIEPGLWRRCVDAAFAGASPEGAAMLLDAVGRGYRLVIRRGEIETSTPLRTRLATMQSLYLERPLGTNGHAVVVSPMFDELRGALQAHRLGPVATRFGEELLSVVDLERGIYQGRAVDVAMMDDLYARRDEATLRRFAQRLPRQELRDEARRRVIRLAIDASPFPEVRARRADVEKRVFDQGSNAISLGEQAPLRARLDSQKTPMREVIVRQDVTNQTASLLGVGGDPRNISVLPEVSLRGTLWVDIRDLSRPVTLCSPASAMDPSPCIEPSEVRIEQPLAYLDRNGAFRFVDHMAESDAVTLAGKGRVFAFPISVGGKRLLTSEWPLRFERPENLVFSEGRSGQGPDLHLTFVPIEAGRFSFTVTSEGLTFRAVLEGADLPAFRVISRGVAGGDGLVGTSGSDGGGGLDGSSASCPGSSGTDGSPGGDGTDGGPGGDGGAGSDGGNIDVEMLCGASACTQDLLSTVRQVVVSEGGAGGRAGRGGSGGRGGRGGAGGSGTTCTGADGMTTSLSSGQSGMNGRDGTSGMDGHDGPPGQRGQVRIGVGKERPNS
jgi:hypothetical protein